MIPNVYEALSGSPAIVALVGDRIFSHGESLLTETPYITWQVIAGVPENNITDLPDIDRFTLQVNCFDSSGQGVLGLAEKVRDVLEINGHVINMPINERDFETRNFWIAFEMDWFFTR